MNTTALTEIVARIALNDDGVAYKQVFAHYYPKLLSFSFAITHCKESSEEAVSDVFVKIWQSRKTLLQVQNFHLYLYVSTKNISLNYLAKQKRTHSFSIDDVKTEIRSLYYDPEQLMISAEMFKRICNAIRELPPRCQLIFKLVKEDNLRYKEVAELLHLSAKTVEAQMTIALKKLGNSVAFGQPSLS